MIEQAVDSYIERVKKLVLDDKIQSIPLAYIAQKDLPQSVKHYFDQEVENWIIEEEAKFNSSDRFDYDVPEVRRKIDEIFDYLKQTATFPLNKFNQLLERAIKLEKDFTIRPQQTMTNFLFKNSTTIRTKQVNDTLRYFFVHDYYKQRLTEYFNLKYMQEINIEQFKELIKQIDDKIFTANPIEESIKMVKTIIDFSNNGADEKDKIDTSLLINAFSDRHIDQYATLFQTVEKSGKLMVSLAEVETYIKDGIKEEVVAPQPVKLDDIDISKVQVKAAVVEEEEDDDDEDEVVAPVAAPTPVSAPVAAASSAPAADKPKDVAEIIKARDAANAVNAANVGAQLANMIGGSKTVQLVDLNTLFNKDQVKNFVKKLFKKDEKMFASFIADINECQNWKDASQHIEDFFYDNDLNPYSDESTQLSDICYLRYFPKS